MIWKILFKFQHSAIRVWGIARQSPIKIENNLLSVACMAPWTREQYPCFACEIFVESMNRWLRLSAIFATDWKSIVGTPPASFSEQKSWGKTSKGWLPPNRCRRLVILRKYLSWANTPMFERPRLQWWRV